MPCDPEYPPVMAVLPVDLTQILLSLSKHGSWNTISTAQGVVVEMLFPYFGNIFPSIVEKI